MSRLSVAKPQRSKGKWAIDRLLGVLLLFLALPLLGLCALLIRLTSRGPAIFVQPRVGLRCQIFPMFKLRTMVDGAEHEEVELAEGLPGATFFKLEDDPRITRVGRWLRRWSLDELPQLLNVVRGDMSLVGPRPLLLTDLERFPQREQLRRFATRPGLTGLWQVMGRSELPDQDRLRLDLEYVDRWSLSLDLEILARTVPAVLSGRGAV